MAGTGASPAQPSLLGRIVGGGADRPRRAMAIAAAFFVFAAIIGGPVPGLLHFPRPFDDPSSDSAVARIQLEHATGAAHEGGIIALVEAPPGSDRVRAVVRSLRAQSGVARVRAPAPGESAAAVSRDGRKTLVVGSLRAGVVPEVVGADVLESFEGTSGVVLGGGEVANAQITELAANDLTTAELLAFPVLALLSFLIFRGIAACLPVIAAALTIPITFMLLRGIDVVLPLSPFALNLVVGLGLGLAVDYSLFLVWRLREELAERADVRSAVAVTIATAGRTVAWSAVTVAVAMLCLTAFPQRFLVSMGIGGALVTAVAALVALTVLPPLFVLLGPRLGRVRPGPDSSGRWYRLTKRVTRRPGLVALVVAALMLVVATPALRTAWSGLDPRVLPSDASAHEVVKRVDREFPGVDVAPMNVIVSAPPSARRSIYRLAQRFGNLPGAVGISPPRRLDSAHWQIDVHAHGDAVDPVAQRLVDSARALQAGYPFSIGGLAAEFRDQRSAVFENLPLAALLLVLPALTILWLMTGSVVLPVKLIVMNVLTTAAATGLLVVVFQDGALAGPLGFRPEGGLELTNFVVFVTLVFALSTDYGVFLLTRIQELRLSGFSNEEALAAGLQRTGRIVTAAAALLAVALLALATSQLVFLKEVGIGAACAVMLDAWVVRGLLMPALMALLGDWNWWSPRPLRRLHEKLGTRLREVGGGPRDRAGVEALPPAALALSERRDAHGPSA